MAIGGISSPFGTAPCQSKLPGMLPLDPGLFLPYVFDLELSGKCNTVCTFCPRDEMKRGEQAMTPETFEHFFGRLKEYVEQLEGQEVVLPHERTSLRHHCPP